jgi:hypothetical protein
MAARSKETGPRGGLPSPALPGSGPWGSPFSLGGGPSSRRCRRCPSRSAPGRPAAIECSLLSPVPVVISCSRSAGTLHHGSRPAHSACCRLRMLAICGGHLPRTATDAVMGADRMPDRGRDLGLGVLALSREVTGEQRLGTRREQLPGMRRPPRDGSGLDGLCLCGIPASIFSPTRRPRGCWCWWLMCRSVV